MEFRGSSCDFGVGSFVVELINPWDEARDSKEAVMLLDLPSVVCRVCSEVCNLWRYW